LKLSTGSRIGPYEIADPLGSGGMGEVYRARDTRLDRTVAIKILSERLKDRPELKIRLEREARAISSLNHPNICTLYDIGNDGEIDYLVMEFIEGESLAAKLRGGPLPVSEALGVCSQIAAGLEAAHAGGILHRDLKTFTVQVTPEGRVKLLDFGLAKTETVATDQAAPEDSPTRDLTATRAGAVLGSPPYMSPEQARGKPIDRRSDNWSFGCILYETLTGLRPFQGETVTDTLAAILDREPDWSALPASTSGPVRGLLRQCLEKDAERRLVEIAEARQILEAELSERGGTAGRGSRTWPRILLAVIALFTVVAVVRYVRTGLPGRSPAPARLLPQFTQATFATAIEESPEWSPDGRRLAFTREVGGIRKIFITDSQGSDRQVTQGDFDDIQPAWAGDASRLLFVRARRPNQKLEPGDVFGQYEDADIWSIDLASGKESLFLEDAFHPSFSPDGGRIAVDAAWVGASRIWLVDDRGRNPVQLTSDPSEAVAQVRPRWSADARHIVFQSMGRAKFDIGVVEIESKRVVPVTNDHYQDLNPVWSPDGQFIYFSSYRSGGLNIWRIPVGADGKPRNRPEQMTTGAGQDVDIAMSPGGRRVAFCTLKQNADLWGLEVDPITGMPTGDAAEMFATTREDSRGSWSADGSKIAFNSDRGGFMNIWVHDLEAGSDEQITEGPGGDFQPNWSPAGDRIAFFSSRAGSSDIWVVDIASGALRNLTSSDSMDVNPFFSPDGRYIAYQSDQGGRLEVWVMEPDGSSPRSLTRIGARGHAMRWSRDGRFVVFRSEYGEGGIFRVPVSGGEAEQLPKVVGGSHISYSPDANLIMDVTGHKTLWISPMTGGEPEPVFEFDDPGVRIDYPVWSPDGRRVLFDRFRPQGGDIWLMTDFE
jgi:Tol biopolymer transport system component